MLISSHHGLIHVSSLSESLWRVPLLSYRVQPILFRLSCPYLLPIISDSVSFRSLLVLNVLLFRLAISLNIAIGTGGELL